MDSERSDKDPAKIDSFPPLPPLPSVCCLSHSNSRIEVKFKDLHIGVCVLSLHHTKYFMTMFMHKNLSLMLDYG